MKIFAKVGVNLVPIAVPLSCINIFKPNSKKFRKYFVRSGYLILYALNRKSLTPTPTDFRRQRPPKNLGKPKSKRNVTQVTRRTSKIFRRIASDLMSMDYTLNLSTIRRLNTSTNHIQYSNPSRQLQHSSHTIPLQQQHSSQQF